MSTYLTKNLPNPTIPSTDVSGWIWQDTLENSPIFVVGVGYMNQPDDWIGRIETEISPTPCFKMLEGIWDGSYGWNKITGNISNVYNILTTPDYHYKINFYYKSDTDYQMNLYFPGETVYEDLPASTTWKIFESDLTAKIIDLNINLSNPGDVIQFTFYPLNFEGYHQPFYIKDINYTYLDPKPNAPSNLTAIAVSSSEIDLNWTDNSADESLFRIYRSLYNNTSWTEIAITTTNVCNYSDNNTNPSILYFYKVCAYNPSGNSSYSNIVSIRPTSIPLNINNIPDFVNAETRSGVSNSEVRFINSGAYLESNTPAIIISNDSYEGTNSLKYVKTSNITHIEINIPLNGILDWSIDKYWMKLYIKSNIAYSDVWIWIIAQTAYGSYTNLMIRPYWIGNAIDLHYLYICSSYFTGKTLTSIKIISNSNIADDNYIMIDDIQVGEKSSLIVRKPFFKTMVQPSGYGIQMTIFSECFMNNTIILEKSTDNVNWNQLSTLTPSYGNDSRGEYYLYSDLTVLPLTTYYYRIKATDTYSTSLYSDSREFTTNSATLLPCLADTSNIDILTNDSQQIII